MSDSKGIDNMESFFKKSFEEFEDLPSKDLWKDISSQIPTYSAAPAAGADTAVSEITKGSVNVGSNAIKTITTILAKKAVIISSAVIMGTTGAYVAYETISKEEQPEAPTQSQIFVADSASASIQEIQTTDESELPQEEKTENVGQPPAQQLPENVDDNVPQKMDPLPADVIPAKDSIPVFEQPVMEHPVKKDTVEEKKPAKKETFYEKNAKKVKDTTRNVFSPE